MSWALVLLLVLAGLVFYLNSPFEPAYQGRYLTDWLRDLREAPPATAEGKALQAKATAAVRQVGVKALPTLLALARSQPTLLNRIQQAQNKVVAAQFARQTGRRTASAPGLKDHLLCALGKVAVLHSRAFVGEDDSWLAAKGFLALGPLAQPAIPELSRMLTNPAVNQEAAVCLAAIGPSAAPALSNAGPGLRLSAEEALPIRLRP